MTSNPLFLIDETGARVAALDVQFRDDHYEGTISLAGTPRGLRRLFFKFEAIVEQQMIYLRDDIEEKIAALRLRVLFDDGSEAEVAELQVFTTTGAVSFKTRQPMGG